MFQDQVVVRKLVFHSSGSFNGQYARSFETHVNQRTLELLNQTTHGGRHVNANALSVLGSEIIVPKANVGQQSQIDNGWGTERFTFIALVEVIPGGNANASRQMVLSGYTGDAYTTTHNNVRHLNPEMRMYVNNVVNLQMYQHVDHQGQRFNSLNIAGSHQLLRPTDMNANFNQGHNEWTMRPCDTMAIAGSAHMMQQTNQMMIDRRTTFDEGVKLSNRRNNVASQYLSKSIINYGAAFSREDSGDIMEITDNASGAMAEGAVLSNSFFDMIARVSSFGEAFHHQAGSFSYGELCSLDRNVDNIAEVVVANQLVRTGYAEAGDSAEWYGANPESVVAYTVASVVPAVMSYNATGRVAFLVTNQTHDGQPRVRIDNIQGFAEGQDMSDRIAIIEQDIINELFIPCSQGNNIALSLFVDTELAGHMHLRISYAGGPEIDFKNPIFADQLNSSILTRNYETAVKMALDIQNISEELIPNTNLNSGQQNGNSRFNRAV